MKKILFFAFAALTLAFTACENNGPKNPSDINVKDYVGSMWFLDSVNVGDFTTTHMCQPIFLLSETSIQLGNDVCPFRYEKGKLYINRYGDMENAYELVSLDNKGAVVKGGDDARGASIYYISALPALDRNKQNAISESAIMGKYKMVIGSMTETDVNGKETTSYTIGGMITWMTFKADHKMLYEDSNPMLDDTEGIWDLNAAEKKMIFGAYSSMAEMHQYGTWENILVFNDDYLVTGTDYDYDASMGFTHRHYESVMLRIK